MLNKGVRRNTCLLVLSLLAFVAIITSSRACDNVFYVDPKGHDAGSFYIIKINDDEWTRQGYLPAGTLVRSAGHDSSVPVSEGLYEQQKSYVPFVSEFGQVGFIQWDDIKHGAVSNLHGAKIQGTDRLINCQNIGRFVAPDNSELGIQILSDPVVGSRVVFESSASYMAAIFVLESDYQDRAIGGNRFLKVHYRVKEQDPLSTGYIDRKDQTSQAKVGRFRITKTVKSVRAVTGVIQDQECNGICWASVIGDLYQSVVDFGNIDDLLAKKPCTAEVNVEIKLSADAGAKASLVGWLNLGVSVEAGATLKFVFPSGEVRTTDRLFQGDRTELGIQRTHKCIGDEKGPAVFVGLRFSGHNNPAKLFATDLEKSCFSRLPASLRAYHTDAMFIVARSDRIIFPRYVALRHLIQDRIEQFVGGAFFSDTQLQELDRLTWMAVEQVLDHQHRQAHGVPPNPCNRHART